MFRRHPSRIRPVRPRRSRGRVALTVVLMAMVGFWAVAAWFDRAEETTVALAPGGPYRIRATSGPIEVVAAESPSVHQRASWLIRGPRTVGVEDGSSDLVIGCPTRFPCRTWTTVEAPPGEELTIEAGPAGVAVTTFSGRLSVTASGDGGVVLGPVRGDLDVSTERGGIEGFGLRVGSATIETGRGPVDLEFREPPQRLVVRAGSEPVRIRLPDAVYAVSVEGASTTDIEVRSAVGAAHLVDVEARGSVVIEVGR